jgi:uncharacterized membrane protein
MPQNTPLKLEELKRKRQECMRSLKPHGKKASLLDRLALWITNKVGSMGFFVLIFLWTVCWLGWNMLAPEKARFDPYPAFVLWLFISNMIQLFLLPLIMIGQNLQSQHSELRAETDLKINELAEMENETILIHLENQNAMMLELLKNMENRAKQAEGH